MKNKFKIEYLIYIYIIISPFLDSFSGMYRLWFPDVTLNPVMFIRPIIPGILILYIFFKDKKTRKLLITSGLIYGIYGLIHLYIFNRLKNGISYGDIFTEGLYVFNYTYNIFMLFIIMYFSKKKKLSLLKNSLLITLFCYLFLIYISIITGTSTTTYITGVGYKSYFMSGNTLGTALLLLFSGLISDGISKRDIKSLISFVLLGVFLIFLLGTKTGMFGYILVLCFYILINIIKAIKNKIKINKVMVISGIGLFLSIGLVLLLVGSNTFNRAKELDSHDYDIVDVNTGGESHVTGDTSKIVYSIKHGEVEEGYMSKEEENAYLTTYNICNKLNIKGNNSRVQQLVYNASLVKEQHNIFYILFGNGYHNNYGEMTLEMEIPALLLNFGIIGIILYLGPYLTLFIKAIKYKKVNDNYIMSLFGITLALGLSIMAGYVLYSGTCSLLIICLFSILKENGDYV